MTNSTSTEQEWKLYKDTENCRSLSSFCIPHFSLWPYDTIFLSRVYYQCIADRSAMLCFRCLWSGLWYPFDYLKTESAIFYRQTVEPRFNEVLRDQGNWFVISRFSSIHFKRPGWRISFVIPRISLYRGSLNRSSTVRNVAGLHCHP